MPLFCKLFTLVQQLVDTRAILAEVITSKIVARYLKTIQMLEGNLKYTCRS